MILFPDKERLGPENGDSFEEKHLLDHETWHFVVISLEEAVTGIQNIFFA
jgi:hypothetical protein